MKPSAEICQGCGRETGRGDEKEFTSSHSKNVKMWLLWAVLARQEIESDKRARPSMRRLHFKAKTGNVLVRTPTGGA
jgi:hypothetical protein